VSARRDHEEFETLIRLAERCREGGGARVVALADGPLLPWVLVRGEPTTREAQERLRGYREQLDRLKPTGAVLAGYVDRPGSAGVTNLMALAEIPAEEISEASLKGHALRGLTDPAIFAPLLKPGQRSALFAHSPYVNAHLDPHRVLFFYVNVGREHDAKIARVDVPEWAVEDRARLDRLHQVIWEQSQVTGGYPYVLARAHELAVITHEQRRALEQMLGSVMLDRGILLTASDKARVKGMVG